MYCSSQSLQKARLHCNQNIENAISNLYECYSMIEYNCSFQDKKITIDYFTGNKTNGSSD
jgi:hypothetical protein